MTDTEMSLTELPTDVLVLVFLYLDAGDFLSLTSSTKSLLQFRQDPTFWRTLTRTTFRIPPQPLLQADGARWQWLYKHLLTKTQVFTWGNNQWGNLGHSQPNAEDVHGLPARRRRVPLGARGIGWPTEMVGIDRVGVVADIQLGGWSTTLLNSVGQIYAVGIIDGQRPSHTSRELTRLEFPAYYPPTTKERYEPSTAIQQYSAGRSHVLGLSDSGRIWLWTNITRPAKLIKFIHVDVLEGGGSRSDFRATRVVGGWDRSTVYVNGTGLLYWYNSVELERNAPEETDALLINSLTIPGTSYRRSRSSFFPPSAPEALIGEVTNHIVLEGYVVFITHLDKIFAYQTSWPEPNPSPNPTELTTFYPQNETGFQMHDLQGSFRSFALFTRSGAVLLGSKSLLDAFCNTSPSSSQSTSLPRPTVIPSLQNAAIISVAFGDYHFHALHANGTISSYGTEPQMCGALGLGPSELAKLRGVHLRPGWDGGDGSINPADYAGWSDGRRTVWFEKEKRRWLADMLSKAHDDEAKVRGGMVLRDEDGAGKVVGEWFEREGRHWSVSPHHNQPGESDGHSGEDMGAYFALKVSAAGWHSGALVLVDEEKAATVKAKYVVKPVESPVEIANGEEAEAEEESDEEEEVSAPWDQLATAINSAGTWVYKLGRWFLGLTDRDVTAVTHGAEGLHAPEVDESGAGEEIYTWHDQAFPRLRLLNGEMMPGEIPPTRWRGEEPVFGP